MATKKTTLVIFGYDDGSYEYAVGYHAEEAAAYINGAQAMYAIHGMEYTGRPMVEVSENGLESIKSIVERTFPKWVAELRKGKL